MDAKKFGDRGHQTFRVFRVSCGPIAFRQTTADYADNTDEYRSSTKIWNIRFRFVLAHNPLPFKTRTLEIQ